MSNKPDPALYREMQKPHASSEAAQVAIDAFLDDVAEARKKHRIADVHVVVQTACMTSEGEEGLVGVSSHYGDSRNGLPMLAREYARERKVLRDYLDRLLKITDGEP